MSTLYYHLITISENQSLGEGEWWGKVMSKNQTCPESPETHFCIETLQKFPNFLTMPSTLQIQTPHCKYKHRTEDRVIRSLTKIGMLQTL